MNISVVVVLCAPLVCMYPLVIKVTHTQLVETYILMGHIKNSNINTTPMFTGLNKTTQKPQMPQEEKSAGRDEELCSQTNVLSVNNENAIALKYFDLRTSAVWQFRKVNSCLRMAK
jgi:hypothetical protein